MYCSPTHPASCPVGYRCKTAVNEPDTFVCCSMDLPETCPQNFIPVFDNVGMQVL